jgi:hypothetical protein
VVRVTLRPRFALGKESQVPIGYEAGLASEPVWTQRPEEKFFSFCGASNPDLPVVHLLRIYTVEIMWQHKFTHQSKFLTL